MRQEPRMEFPRHVFWLERTVEAQIKKGKEEEGKKGIDMIHAVID